MNERVCYKCNQPNGTGPRELRPYGPGGKDICAECCFADPKLEKEAREQFRKKNSQIEKRGLVPIIGTSSGPIPMIVPKKRR